MISLNLLELLVCLYLARSFENLNKITTFLIILDQKKDTVICGWAVPPMINVKWFFNLLKWNEPFFAGVDTVHSL